MIVVRTLPGEGVNCQNHFSVFYDKFSRYVLNEDTQRLINNVVVFRRL